MADRHFSIFSKKGTKLDGSTYYYFITRKHSNLTGNDEFLTVYFPEGHAPKKTDCPINIIVPDGKCRQDKKRKVNEETGVISTRRILYIDEWLVDEGNPFVDHSMDEFD